MLPVRANDTPEASRAHKDKLRQERFMSHALVSIKKFKWLPFAIHSAVLLDISLLGFKIEFTGDADVKIGTSYWLDIPLSPLGIYAPKRLLCHCECRWFDKESMRFGGIFIELDKTQRLIIDQIVETLALKGRRL